jgi:hypothetical protein
MELQVSAAFELMGLSTSETTRRNTDHRSSQILEHVRKCASPLILYVDHIEEIGVEAPVHSGLLAQKLCECPVLRGDAISSSESREIIALAEKMEGKNEVDLLHTVKYHNHTFDSLVSNQLGNHHRVIVRPYCVDYWGTWW